MKKVFYSLAILIYCLPHSINAQNLVPNPSFEIDTSCASYGVIYYALPWFQPCTYSGNTTNSSSSDLYGPCSPYWDSGVPLNVIGYQFARTDSAYVGIYCYRDTSNVREYIEVPLLNSLLANHTYCVQFYVSLANTSGRAISNIGAFFSIDSLLDNRLYKTINNVTPQVENPAANILSDTLNWMLVSGSFTATGGEKFMTIGNFKLPINTNSQLAVGGLGAYSYYYFDDISVVDCTNSGINEMSNGDSFKLYPNPNNGTMTLDYHIGNVQTGIVSIYDMAGKLISSQNFNGSGSRLSIDAELLNAGAYYYEIKIDNIRTKADKLIIIK